MTNLEMLVKNEKNKLAALLIEKEKGAWVAPDGERFEFADGARTERQAAHEARTHTVKWFKQKYASPPWPPCELNKFGNNVNLRFYLREPEIMRSLGFTESPSMSNPEVWHDWKFITEKDRTVYFLLISIDMAARGKIRVYNRYGQRYDWQKALRDNPSDKDALRVRDMVEDELDCLAAAGIISGHMRGEYI